MKQLLVTISASQPLAPNLDLLTLAAPELPQLRAGQLLLARWPGRYEPYVRAAHFPVALAATPDAWGLLIRPGGEHKARPYVGTEPAGQPATVAYAAEHTYTIGDVLDVLAPVGNGFTLEASTRRLLLAGDESRLAPLLALAQEATQKQIAVSLLIEQGRDDLPGRLYESLLPVDVEYQIVRQLDISAELLGWCDQVCAAGTLAFYTQLKERMAHTLGVQPPDFAQVIVAPTMPCGSGACLGCAVETTRGLKLACLDGPVFDLLELV